MTRSTSQPEIAEAYDDWAKTYDIVENRTRDLAAEVLRKTDLNLTGCQLIEVGCGTGRNTEWLAERGAGIVGMDFSEAMLARAQKRINNPRVRFLQQDIREPWPLPDNSADVVIAMLVLEHVDNLKPVFREAARVLGATGEFFICELHPERQLLGKQARFTSVASGEDKLVTAFLHRTEDYIEAGEGGGFKVVKLDEWHDQDAPEDPPRLLSIHFRSGGN